MANCLSLKSPVTLVGGLLDLSVTREREQSV